MEAQKPKIALYVQRSFGEKLTATFDFIKENWPESTMTSDNMFDNIKDKRPYKESDLIYTNKIKTHLKQLEESENKKIIMSNKDLTR